MSRWLVVFCKSATLSLFLLSSLTLWQCLQKSPDASGMNLILGIGFDLTASYGTVAISHTNGSTEPIAMLQTNHEFHEMMQKLSLDTSAHIHPPYENLDEYFRDQPRQWKRSARKAVGLPASEDVGVLASVLKDLKAHAEKGLGRSIELAIATVPHLVALYVEDIADALEYAGIGTGDVRRNYKWSPNELSAGYAGYGFSLCDSYTNASKCASEEEDMPYEVVLAILYTKTVLGCSMDRLKATYAVLDWPVNNVYDFQLGSDYLHDNPGEEYYWEAVRERIIGMRVAESYMGRITKVVVLGESAFNATLNATFFKTLEEALGPLDDEFPEIVKDDPIYAAAKGAAELARRSAYTELNEAGVAPIRKTL